MSLALSESGSTERQASPYKACLFLLVHVCFIQLAFLFAEITKKR